MITFSFRAKTDRDPKWGPKGRRIWMSDCGMYRIEERHEYEGLAIARKERYLAIAFGTHILGRSLTKKAAITRCTQHDLKRRKINGSDTGNDPRVIRRRRKAHGSDGVQAGRDQHVQGGRVARGLAQREVASFQPETQRKAANRRRRTVLHEERQAD